jgi:tetratricopeptide (TPR) repeat protein
MAVLNSSSKNSAVMNSFVNLGVLFASIDRYDEALEMLNKASAKATDKKEKAEILYRMAELSRSSGDLREASRTLKYALSLDSSNNKARLLQKKISAEEKEKE